MSTEAAPPRSVLHDGVRAPVLASVASAVLATAVVLSGVRGTGHRLVRDFVAVPDPAAPSSLLPTSAAELRAWPLDAVTWAASAAIPTAVQQVVLLVLSILLAGIGTGLLVATSLLGRAGPRGHPGEHGGPGTTAAAAAAAWVAVWNPYVLERLLLGHAPTLLGYACLPWIVLVARSRLRTASRLAVMVVVAIPAALTPWGGVVALATAVLADLSRPDRRRGRTALVAGIGIGWCLPWVVPGILAGGVAADPDGAAAFALADDSGFGTWLSALMGGGVWATGAHPASRTDPVSLTASLVLVAVAFSAVVGLIAGSVTTRRHGRRSAPRPSTEEKDPDLRRAVVAGLLLLAPATLAWWASGPGLDVMTALQAVPGVAVFRDQHRILAPGVIAQGVLAGAVVVWLGRHGGRLAATLGCGVVVALAVASVPDLPREMRTAYRPVSYPAEWDAVIASLHGGVAETTAVSLPWQPLRRPVWAGDPPFLDPLPRAVDGEVLISTALAVRRDGALVVVDDSPLDQTWVTGDVSAESLRRHGATHVVEWLGTPGALATSHDGWSLLHSGADFRVWDVTGAR